MRSDPRDEKNGVSDTDGRIPLPPTAERAERELDDELRLHLELRAEANRARGMSAEDARRAALLRFGDVDDARDSCKRDDSIRVRRVRRRQWIEELSHDMRFAARGLRRAPAFTISAVATLALGVGLAIAAYAVA